MTAIQLRGNGTYDVFDGKRALLEGCQPTVIYRDKRGGEKIVRTREISGEEVVGQDDQIEILFQCERDSAWMHVRNIGNEILSLSTIKVLSAQIERDAAVHLGDISDLTYLQHGWQSWSPVRILPLEDPGARFSGDDYDEKHVPHTSTEGGVARSEWFTIIRRSGTAKALLIGFTTAGRQLSEIQITTGDCRIESLDAICFADGIELGPRDTFVSERMWISAGGPQSLLQEYSSRLGSQMGARTHMPAMGGWCTWYYYFGENDERDLAAALAAKQDKRLPLDFILIDDGYQTAIGDWTSIRPDKFPSGMRAAARAISNAGSIPGIWVAPFGARHDSKLAVEHPEYFLRDESDKPVLAWHHWNEPIYALDLTREDVLDHLRRLFRIIKDDWGFELFKLDFIFAGAAPGVHHDKRATRAMAYRRGLEPIREIVGEEKWILGCGAPQAASVGLVDAMRISQDVSITWKPLVPDPSSPAVSQAIQNTIHRAPFHRRLWVNDPDCLILRTRGHASILTKNESRTLTTVCALGGGLVYDGDRLSSLSPAELDDLRRVLPPLDRVAEARDLFANVKEPPGRLDLHLRREWGDWFVLAIINWAGRSRDCVIDLPGDAAYYVYDFWRKEYLGHFRRSLTKMAQAPHATRLLMVTPTGGEPRLIASSFHIGGGYLDIVSIERKRKAMRVEMEKPGQQRGELVFAIPDRPTTITARVNGRRISARAVDRRVVAISFTLDEKAVIELEW